MAKLKFTTFQQTPPPVQPQIVRNISVNLQSRSFKPLTITRTVKNEQARNPNSIIIDTRDSSDEEEENAQDVQSIHKNKTRKRRRSSFGVSH